MKIEIGVIAPDEELLLLASSIIKNCSEPIGVRLGFLSQGIETAQLFIAEGAKVLISRGGTTQKIRESGITLPVIDIPITGYDIIELVNQARRISNRAVVIGFEPLVKGVQYVGPLLDLEVVPFQVQSEGEVYEKAKRARESGIDVLIGARAAVECAARLGMRGIMIRSEEGTVKSAIFEATKVLQSLRKEREWGEKLQNVFDSMHDGVIAVNSEGKITHVNSIISNAVGIDKADLMQQPIEKIIKGMSFKRTVEQGKPVEGRIEELNNTQYVVNSTPIIINKKAYGAIVTVQRLEHIQSLERNVRRKLYQKGHLAKYRFKDIVTRNPDFMDVIGKARQFAEVDSTVLILGETGTGKEVMAQSVHNNSRRQAGPFVAVNCGALPENLLESELFGYLEGAFTGAKKGGKPGLFELAHGGTLFLDEVNEMSVSVQAKLLRALEERQVMRIGGDAVTPVDVRVVCATNRELNVLVAEGRFRPDLYYRINVLKLNLPPLRKRREDVLALVDHYLNHFCRCHNKPSLTLDEDARQALLSYEWPGNVRELRNIVETSVITSKQGKITLADVSGCFEEDFIGGNDAEGLDPRGEEKLSLAKLKERQLILTILDSTQGNRVEAAKRLGMSRTTLWRKINRYQIT